MISPTPSCVQNTELMSALQHHFVPSPTSMKRRLEVHLVACSINVYHTGVYYVVHGVTFDCIVLSKCQDLMSREYVSRDKANPKLYHYVAWVVTPSWILLGRVSFATFASSITLQNENKGRCKRIPQLQRTRISNGHQRLGWRAKYFWRNCVRRCAKVGALQLKLA